MLFGGPLDAALLGGGRGGGGLAPPRPRGAEGRPRPRPEGGAGGGLGGPPAPLGLAGALGAFVVGGGGVGLAPPVLAGGGVVPTGTELFLLVRSGGLAVLCPRGRGLGGGRGGPREILAAGGMGAAGCACGYACGYA